MAAPAAKKLSPPSAQRKSAKPAAKSVKPPVRLVHPSTTRISSLEEDLSGWFDGLEFARAAVVARLIVDICRHAQPLEQSDHYLIERGSHYLGAMFRCSPDQANKGYLPYLERIMGLIRAMRLDPRDEKDRARILSMVTDRRPGRMATYWRLTGRAVQALYALGKHARALGHAVPAYHLGPAVRLRLAHTVGRVRRAHCPVVPDHGAELALNSGGHAYCFKCRAPVGRWRDMARGMGVTFWPYVEQTALCIDSGINASSIDEVEPTESEAPRAVSCLDLNKAGSPVNIFDRPTGPIDDARRVHAGMPIDDVMWLTRDLRGRSDTYGASIRPAGYVVRQVSRRDRYTTAISPIQALVSMQRKACGPKALAQALYVEGSMTPGLDAHRTLPGRYLSLDLRQHAALSEGFERAMPAPEDPHRVRVLRHPERLSRALGQQWIGLSIRCEAAPMAGDETDRLGGRRRSADSVRVHRSVGDQALHRAGLALQADLAGEPWASLFTGRFVLSRTGVHEAEIGMELAYFRTRPDELIASPDFQRVLAELAQRVQAILGAHGWTEAQVQIPRGAGGYLLCPGYRMTGVGDHQDLVCARVVYATPPAETDPVVLYLP